MEGDENHDGSETISPLLPRNRRRRRLFLLRDAFAHLFPLTLESLRAGIET